MRVALSPRTEIRTSLPRLRSGGDRSEKAESAAEAG